MQYTKFIADGFCIGNVIVDVPINKDKWQLKLPDPYSWRIYGGNDITTERLYSPLSFDFQSHLEVLPPYVENLEEYLRDEAFYCHANYPFHTFENKITGPNFPWANHYQEHCVRTPMIENHFTNCEPNDVPLVGSGINQYPSFQNVTNNGNVDPYNEKTEKVNYFIFLNGFQCLKKYPTKDVLHWKSWANRGYNVRKIYDLKITGKSQMFVKNVPHNGTWVRFTGFN